ncbi:outer membrane protein transport protein [soil metagenome]
MNHVPRALGAAAALVAVIPLAPIPASAAGIERAVPSTRVLFREGNYAEFNLAHVRPHLTGRGANLSPIGRSVEVVGFTGNLFEDYTQLGLAVKSDITERISYALILDEPVGADTRYGEGNFLGTFTYAGTRADFDSIALTGILAYDVTPQIKAYGGLRAQRLRARAAIPFINNYTVVADPDWSYGYMLGAAYQLPEIALRVALTYYSRISHSHDTRELGQFDTRTDIETPQSVNLEFQTGIAEDTLAFGSVRWVDWSSFRIAPPVYGQITAAATGEARALVDYDDDWWTYTLGLGYRFDPQLSGAVQASFEPSVGGELTTLGPIDGRSSLGGSLTYEIGNVELTGGLTVGRFGSTRNILNTEFRNGTFTALGLRVGFTF